MSLYESVWGFIKVYECIWKRMDIYMRQHDGIWKYMIVLECKW